MEDHHRSERQRNPSSRRSSDLEVRETQEEHWPGSSSRRSSFSSRRYHQTPRESEEEESDQSRTNYTRRRYSLSPLGTRDRLSRTETFSRHRGEVDGTPSPDDTSRQTHGSAETPEENKNGSAYVRRRYYSMTRKVQGPIEADGSRHIEQEAFSEHRGGIGRGQGETGSSARTWTSRYGQEGSGRSHSSVRGGDGAHEGTTEGRHRQEQIHSQRHGAVDQDVGGLDWGSRGHLDATQVSQRRHQTHREESLVQQRHRLTSTSWRNGSIDLRGEPSSWSEEVRRRYGSQERGGSSEDTGRPSYSRTSYTRRTNGTSYVGGTYYSRWSQSGRDNISHGSSLSYGSSRTSGTYGGSESVPGHTRQRTTQAPFIIDRVDILEEERHPLSGKEGLTTGN